MTPVVYDRAAGYWLQDVLDRKRVGLTGRRGREDEWLQLSCFSGRDDQAGCFFGLCGNVIGV